jgi:hypothetical protein
MLMKLGGLKLEMEEEKKEFLKETDPSLKTIRGTPTDPDSIRRKERRTEYAASHKGPAPVSGKPRRGGKGEGPGDGDGMGRHGKVTIDGRDNDGPLTRTLTAGTLEREIPLRKDPRRGT